jgi:hypothetical protein
MEAGRDNGPAKHCSEMWNGRCLYLLYFGKRTIARVVLD